MSSNTLVIYVKPDPDIDPEVHLNQRDVSASGATKVRWKKDPTWVEENPDSDFDFIGFVPIKDYTEEFHNPFKNISVNQNRIKCELVGAVTGPEYKYTVALEYQNEAINSDEESPPGPSHGRAVIRN